MDMQTARQILLLLLLALAAIVMVALGLLTLFGWEIAFFRLTTFDRDFTGSTCGSPLDNPGWPTGSPCHGAVNRQTAAAWVTLAGGLCCLLAAAVFALQHRRQSTHAATGDAQ